MAGDSTARDLDFGLSRRAFFRALFVEAREAAASLYGRPGFALRDLETMAGDELARLIPEIQPLYNLYVEEERLLARHAETGVVLDLLPASPERVLALNLFDGHRPLGSAGRRLATQMGWDEQQGFAAVRELFLALVARLVCLPRNTLEPGG